jgi:phage repressor protein C with HTH and peptisase S24 domain/DNA-binding XRE family transcriptional regulator
METNLWDRIRWLRKVTGLTQQDVADACEISRTAVSLWETDDADKRTTPTNENLQTFLMLAAQNIDKDPGPMWAWLMSKHSSIGNLKNIYGEAEDESDAIPLGTSPVPIRGALIEHGNPSRVILIPRLDISASMGEGALNPEYDTVVDHLRLSADWARKNLTVSNPQNLKALSAYGDSMIPAFNDGDILIVDTGVHELKIDAIYVLRWDDELYVKRVQRHPETDTISIISDNPIYKPKEVPKGENGFEVLGRVVWAWNGKKL